MLTPDYVYPRALAGHLLLDDQDAHDELARLLVMKYGVHALLWVIEAARIYDQLKDQKDRIERLERAVRAAQEVN